MSSQNSYTEAVAISRMTSGDGILGENNVRRAEPQYGLSVCIERRRECSLSAL